MKITLSAYYVSISSDISPDISIILTLYHCSPKYAMKLLNWLRFVHMIPFFAIRCFGLNINVVNRHLLVKSQCKFPAVNMKPFDRCSVFIVEFCSNVWVFWSFLGFCHEFFSICFSHTSLTFVYYFINN